MALNYGDVVDAARGTTDELTRVSIKLALARFDAEQPLTLISSNVFPTRKLLADLRRVGHGHIRLRVSWVNPESGGQTPEEWLLVSAQASQLERLQGRCFPLVARDVNTSLAVIASAGRPGLRLHSVVYPVQSFIEATISHAASN